MGVLRQAIAPGWTILRTEDFPTRLPRDRPRAGEVEVWIGIGGNLGRVDRRFRRLWYFLRGDRDLRPLESSPILLNPPFGYLDQPEFHNAVLRVATRSSPGELMRRLLRIEGRFGRRRSFANAPRTLDLDLLFYGDRRVRSRDLRVPHPRWRERLSVTIPLAMMKRMPPSIRRGYPGTGAKPYRRRISNA